VGVPMRLWKVGAAGLRRGVTGRPLVDEAKKDWLGKWEREEVEPLAELGDIGQDTGRDEETRPVWKSAQ